MSAEVWLVIAVLPPLVLLSALFSAFETGLFSVEPARLRALEISDPPFAARLSRLLEKPRRLLSTLLLADAVVNLPLVIVCIFLMREVFESPLPFWVTALGIFAIVVLACDLIPKVAAQARPIPVARVGVRVLGVIMPVLDPLAAVLQRMSEWMADVLTPRSFQSRKILCADELETFVTMSAEAGALQETESEMIQEIIKMESDTARDIMTPRTDTFALPNDLTNEEAILQLKAQRHRRVPVYVETPDDIAGVLDVKKFIGNPSAHYTEMLDGAEFVPETMKAFHLLKLFLDRPRMLAVIVDEFGGMEGIVTLSDVVEEILGDAVPADGHEMEIVELGRNRWLVNAAMRLDDLGEELGMKLEEEGIDTIGGLVFNTLGYMPPAGARLDVGEYSFTVRRTSGNRMQELVVTRRESSAERGIE